MKSKTMILNQKGFSLVELIIVIAILGILAAISINMFSGVLGRSREKADQARAQQIQKAIVAYVAESGDSNLGRINAASASGNTTTITPAAPTGNAGANSVLIGLQKQITTTDYTNVASTWGPYLEAKPTTAAPSAQSYYPQDQKNKGWDIVVTMSTGQVTVTPITTATANAANATTITVN